MSKPWLEDQQYLIKAIGDYRKVVHYEELKADRNATKAFAEGLYHSTSELQHRSLQAIIERLPYLDNLLDGIFEKHSYALKDQQLYGTKVREVNSTVPNESVKLIV
jgi:hypothetical protein